MTPAQAAEILAKEFAAGRCSASHFQQVAYNVIRMVLDDEHMELKRRADIFSECVWSMKEQIATAERYLRDREGQQDKK